VDGWQWLGRCVSTMPDGLLRDESDAKMVEKRRSARGTYVALGMADGRFKPIARLIILSHIAIANQYNSRRHQKCLIRVVIYI